MKRITVSLKKTIYLLTASSLILIKANAEETYLSANYGVVNSSDNKILNSQPVDELVGSSGSQVELRLGLSSLDVNNKEQSRAFFYLWNNAKKNNETGIGIGAEWIMHPYDNNFGFIIGGQAGLGYQDVSGKKKRISSNVNKVSYILNNNNSVPTIAEFQDDTYVLDIALTLGSSYQFSKHLSFDLGYVYKYDLYQVSYRNQDSKSILNQLSINQDNHMLKMGLNYRF